MPLIQSIETKYKTSSNLINRFDFDPTLAQSMRAHTGVRGIAWLLPRNRATTPPPSFFVAYVQLHHGAADPGGVPLDAAGAVRGDAEQRVAVPDHQAGCVIISVCVRCHAYLSTTGLSAS